MVYSITLFSFSIKDIKTANLLGSLEIISYICIVFRKRHNFFMTAPHIRITTSKLQEPITHRANALMRRRFCDVSKVVVNLGYAWTMSAHLR